MPLILSRGIFLLDFINASEILIMKRILKNEYSDIFNSIKNFQILK
jgi:hypothetical protein